MTIIVYVLSVYVNTKFSIVTFFYIEEEHWLHNRLVTHDIFYIPVHFIF